MRSNAKARRFLVRLREEPVHAGLRIDDAATPIEAAILFAERAGETGALAVVVVDCETLRSSCVLIDLESGEIGAC